MKMNSTTQQINNSTNKQKNIKIMKNLFYLLLAVAFLSSCEKGTDDNPIVTKADSIAMGTGYAEDVYYSLENGVVQSSPRSNWDIAFSTNPMTSTVLINEGYGIELFAYPNGDLSAWDNVDITNLDQWTPMYNAEDTTWMNGAFDRNAMGHPDYGWGLYNTQNHDVIGDSLFIIKLSDGTFKKIAIEKRAAMTNSFFIKYGDIGSAGVSKEISCADYTSKNFIYFSLTTGEVVDNEPASADWDIVFTKYYDESIPYIVTGVLTNENYQTAKVQGIDTELATPEDGVYSKYINVIGSDWKSYNRGTSTYDIEQDLSYFVKTQTEEVYKIIFTGTDGSATGKMVFTVEKAD